MTSAIKDAKRAVERRGKFVDPQWTETGEPRARVSLEHLTTLWFNTGTLCNLTCEGCYIESSPRNDRLVYLARGEVSRYLDEAEECHPELEEVGFTGGEPFMNPDFLDMLEEVLTRGWRALVLTNAMRPMRKCAVRLLGLRERFPKLLRIRVSLDHYTQQRHEALRGPRSWRPAIEGLKWLGEQGFELSVASRTVYGEDADTMRDGYRQLFAEIGLDIPAEDPARLVLFPEMNPAKDVPEITESCWAKLDVSPTSPMCAGSRMIVKRRGDRGPTVVSCTLLPYDAEFDLGPTLSDADRTVSLNHPFCAQFCVLGGASCSPGGDHDS